MKLVRKHPSELTLDPSNARKHSQKNLDAIKGSLSKFGQQKPIVINEKNIVIAGNGTLTAARELGWEVIDCVVTTLQGYEELAFALADNRTSELAEWDNEVLNQALEGLDDIEFDLSAIGFDDWNVDQKEKDDVTAGAKEFLVVVECRDEPHQAAIYGELSGRGEICKIM